MKTNELIGRDLDKAVAMALDWVNFPTDSKEHGSVWYHDKEKAPFCRYVNIDSFSPSADWLDGGAIIEQQGIWLRGPHDATKLDGTVVIHINHWYAHKDHKYVQKGPTPLIAAMRCLVCSKLGDNVQL